MKRFKVIDQKGFHFGGELIENGDKFSAEENSAHITTALHFKQIEPVKEKAESEPDPEADAKAKAEADKLAADAKAKAEADAKGKK